MLQQSTGILTGSVYKSSFHLKTNGFPGEGVMNSSVIVIKTHKLDRTANPEGANEQFLHSENSHPSKQFNKAILLVRNPHEAILSDFNRIKGHHTGHAEPSDFKSGKWQEFFYTAAKEWKRFNLVWLKLFERYFLINFASCYNILNLSIVRSIWV